MGRGIVQLHGVVVPAAQQGAFRHQHRAHGHLVQAVRLLGLFEGELHEVDVVAAPHGNQCGKKVERPEVGGSRHG